MAVAELTDTLFTIGGIVSPLGGGTIFPHPSPGLAQILSPAAFIPT